MSLQRDRAVARLSAGQQGAISRSQVLSNGGTSSWVRAQVSAKRWQRVFPGTYVTTTGPITWMTRAEAALLYTGTGAMLGPRASAYVHGMVRQPPQVIDVLVPSSRRVRSQRGIRILLGARPERASPSKPAHLHRAATVVGLLEAARDDDALVAVLCDGVRAGCPPEAVRAELASRARVRRRRLLEALLAEVEDGIESPLERRYQRDVERRHGLPHAELQRLAR